LPDVGQIFRSLAGVLLQTARTGALLMVSFVVTVFVAFDPHVYHRGVLWLVPTEQEAIARQTMDRLLVAMRWWMVGRLASMTAVGILTSLGMWLIGMPAPMALGALAGLLSFVPNIGPIAAAVPGLLLAMGQGPWVTLGVLCVYLVAQLIESNAITPLVEQYAVSVPPGVLIVTQFVFAALAGAWGMIVSTPLLVVVMVLVQQLYVRQRLQKPIEVTGST
jgi:predicted PurR-regulated permease PerM